MYLVDTSVWIDYLRESKTQPVQFFMEILNQQLPFGITGIIYQEILQGATSNKDFEYLSDYLETQRFYHPKNDIQSYQAAAQIYFKCRNQGITIRSTIDCIIAQIAIEYDLILLHNDKDFIRIKEITPHLKLLGPDV